MLRRDIERFAKAQAVELGDVGDLLLAAVRLVGDEQDVFLALAQPGGDALVERVTPSRASMMNRITVVASMAKATWSSEALVMRAGVSLPVRPRPPVSSMV